MQAQVADALARLPDYFGGHVLVSMTALAIGLVVSMPLALFSVRRPLLKSSLLAAASVAQTIPGLALLALFYPILLGVSALSERLLGFQFSALGFLPAVLALALYSMLPILRNTIAALAAVDPAIKEAALGVGMSHRQSLRMVELPLALPLIMAGIRTASALVIGTATLSTPIGQTSLGNYIFAGLQTQNWVFVLFGCVAAATLALGVDQLLSQLEIALFSKNRHRLALAASGLILIVAFPLMSAAIPSKTRYVIGSKPFGEQYILASLIENRLHESGLATSRRDGLGSSVILEALAAGDIDVYVEYSGTIWANQMQRTDVMPRNETLQAVGQWLAEQYHIRMVGGLGFENSYALAMLRTKAEGLRVNTLADLAPYAAKLSVAGDYEFFGRPEWKALTNAYRLEFRQQKQMQPEFMYRAAAAGEIDVISAYTSDGRVAQYDFQVLADPKGAIPPYDAMLLLSPKRAEDIALVAALRPLINTIDVAAMRSANRAVSEGSTPERAAQMLEAMETDGPR